MAFTTHYAPSNHSTVASPQWTPSNADEKTTEKLKQQEKEDVLVVTPPLTPILSFPDGGVEAWNVVAGAWLVSFCTFGYVNAFGVYQDYYQHHQLSAYTPSDISWIGSVQLAFIFWGGLITGRLFDKGYLKEILLVGSALTVFSLMMTSLASAYYQIILAQGIGLGLGFGLIYVPSISCISHYFRGRRALANGILASGSSSGGIVFPIMLNKLANNPNVGFGWAVRATAFVMLGCLVAANFLLKTRLPAKVKGRAVDFRVFKEAPFTTYTIGASFVLLGIYLPFFYLQSYAILKGVDPNLAFYSLAILNAASFFGRIIPNFVADYVGALNVLIGACFVTSILVFVFLAVHNAAGVVVYSVFFGLFSGTYVSLIPAAVASLTEDMSTIGLRNGMCFFVIGFAALFGTPIAGAIVARQGGTDFTGAAIFSGLSCLIGVGVLCITRALQARRKEIWRV